ncbi:GNAT family N-acetyltransferase [Amycolatopsis anabasis]|uniref:GNAT family N-acetyltransferase n=1 Tax=Amycolatopsis anabasis TaxID=1840409 RepID=UPI00131BDD8F|nr:GNAT family N-acetyltransferase [Amycolatopsis anabasis]
MSIQSYLRRNATHGRDTERIGPFLATFSPGTANPFLNYAIPDDGATPRQSDVDGLTEAFRRRALLPRLEFIPGTAPAAERVLLDRGYSVERRVPLMVCPPGSVAGVPVPPGIELVVPASDAEFAAMSAAQHIAFGEPAPIDPVEHPTIVESGGFAVLAREAGAGATVGGGVGDVVSERTTEIAGIGVLEPYRRRGIAAAITAFLTREAHERGVRTAFLTPGGEAEERVYARVGYRPADEMLHLRLE